MKYFISTIERGSKFYISGCILLNDNESKTHNKKHVFEAPVEGDIISKNGKYQYILTKEGKIEFEPESDTADDLKKEKGKEKVGYIRLKYSSTDEIKLLNQAIVALVNKEDVPDAYKEYRAYVNNM